MSSRRLKRIANEIKELNDSINILKESGIYFHYNEEDMSVIYAMMVGPEKTPYEKGFYFFKFKYPENYPMEPPSAKYCTQGILKGKTSNFSVRFNPNLYTCGKVCLSMLNTWSGPGWVPTNTMSNVLVAIQALVLNDEPLRNEPGFENSPVEEINKYNHLIEYANIGISVLNMVENPPKEFEPFHDIMKDIFLKNIDHYRNFLVKKNEEFDNKLIESPAYGMRVMPDYLTLLNAINDLEIKLQMDRMTMKLPEDETTIV